jgi:hypothetical protein
LFQYQGQQAWDTFETYTVGPIFVMNDGSGWVSQWTMSSAFRAIETFEDYPAGSTGSWSSGSGWSTIWTN